MDQNTYLNNLSGGNPHIRFDPSFIQTTIDVSPQYFNLDGNTSKKRERTEIMFNQIGGSVVVGASLGGVSGLFNGIKEAKLKNLSGAATRTQTVTSIVKTGGTYAQGLGTIAAIFCVFNVIFNKLRSEDELNTLGAATATGLLYKSSAGLKKSMRGGIAGLGIAAAYVFLTSREQVRIITGF